MPISTVPALPSSGSLAFRYSQSNASFYGLQIKVIPKNFDGSVFDCSSITGASTKLNAGSTFAGVPVDNALTTTVVTGDATGLILKFSAANILTAANLSATTGSGKFTIDATDGTTTIEAATGSWSIIQDA